MSNDELKDIQVTCFRPDLVSDRDRLKSSGNYLAYYTSADVAQKVILHKELWLRSVNLMNDYSEVTYGTNLLVAAYKDEEIYRLTNDILSAFGNDTIGVFEEAFNNLTLNLRYNTYAICFSEMRAVASRVGQLSMWRGYGGSNGVALLFDPKHLKDDDTSLSAVLLRMLYLDEAGFTEKLREMIRSAYLNKHKLLSLQREQVLHFFLLNFALLVLQVKHPAFSEENEWRLLVNTELFGDKNLLREVACIAGAPQKIFKVPMTTEETQLQQLLHSVLVGPSPVAPSISEALGLLLADEEMEGVEIIPTLISYRDRM